jgi:predicted RNA-binding Zn-ribbon protein involved in translation (DUF1610 family)
MKFCTTCAYKIDTVDVDTLKVCPHCHNHSLVETSDYEIPKRKDLKSFDEDE